MRAARPLVCLLVLLSPAPGLAETPKSLIKRATAAWKEGREADALALATRAVQLAPKNPEPYLFRGSLFQAAGKHQEAVRDYDRVIALAPGDAEAYHQRGCEHFKLGRLAESVADFDRYIELKPERKASHWQRGISYYYVGRYRDGQEQFEGYQTFESNDVENAVWRYLCMAKLVGRAKARGAILKVGEDRRVPMKEVYALFSGKGRPGDVLAASEAGAPGSEQRNSQLFYAHLYLGLWYAAEEDQVRALEHLSKAVEHRIGHYMWDVARVHRDLLLRAAGPR